MENCNSLSRVNTIFLTVPCNFPARARQATFVFDLSNNCRSSSNGSLPCNVNYYSFYSFPIKSPLRFATLLGKTMRQQTYYTYKCLYRKYTVRPMAITMLPPLTMGTNTFAT